MTDYIVQDGQSIFDIAVLVYGDINKSWDLIDDNSFANGLDTDIQGNQVLLIRPFTANTLSNFFVRYQHVVNNSDYEDNGIITELTLVLLEIGNENISHDGYIIIDVQGGVPDFIFEWRNQDTDVVVGTSQNLSAVPAGTYKVTVIDSEGTSATLTNLTVSAIDHTEYLIDEHGNFITDENGNFIIVNQ